MNRILLASLVLVWSATAFARDDYRLLDLDRFDVSYEEFRARRDSIMPEVHDWKFRAAINWDLTLARYVYWHNYVHTESVPAQVRTVGWQWQLGARLTNWLSVWAGHHSQHVMDDRRPSRFPVEDSAGITLRLVDDPRHPGLLP